MKKLHLGLAALLSVAGGVGAAQADTIFLGAYPDKIMTIDEAKGAVTQVVDLPAGLPNHLTLSGNKKLIYATTMEGGISVFDVATRKVINSVSLNTPTERYRFSGGAADPTGRYFYTTLQLSQKLGDRYEIKDHQYAVIDLKTKKIAKMTDMAEEDIPSGRFWRASYKISPDGKYLYLFQDKVVVLDTATLKVVKRFDVAKPEGTGLEGGNIGSSLDSLSSPGEYVSLFEAKDPYIRNKVFGIGRFDLAKKTMDFKPIGNAPASIVGFEVTPDGKDGYAVVTESDLGNKRCEFWHFDVANAKLVNKAEFQCRSRFYFSMSGDGSKLYIYGAGHEIELYDAKTLAYDTTWELNHDTTMAGIIILK